jgi:hypothetical protein
VFALLVVIIVLGMIDLRLTHRIRRGGKAKGLPVEKSANE